MSKKKALRLDSFKAIFFDAGGTLFYPFPSVGEIYRDTAKRYGCNADAVKLEALFRQAWLKRDGLTALVSHSDEKKEKSWWHQLVREVFSEAGEVNDFDTFFGELFEIFGRPEVWKLYPGTLDLLAHLKRQGKKVGIISNWDSRLFQLCRGLGVESHVDFILASAVFGAAKPSPKIFREALEKAAVEPHEAIHIGDSVEDDIRGAEALGISALLVNRHPERFHPVGHEVHGLSVIHDLTELIE